MTRLLDKTWTTEDEGYLEEDRIADAVLDELRALKLDTYNSIYVVRITVDRVDETTRREDDDD